MLRIIPLVHFLLLTTASVGVMGESRLKRWDLHMPNVTTFIPQAYRCYMEPVPEPGYIVRIESNILLEQAHHMLLFGKSFSGNELTGHWNCGDRDENGEKPINSSVLDTPDFSMLIYGSGKEAPTLVLPKGSGYKIGGNTPIHSMIMQVHYKEKVVQPDESGVTLYYTTDKLKPAGTVFLNAGGSVKPCEVGYAEGACLYSNDQLLHPYAFRVHTHDHGTMVSAYAIQKGKWNLIGKMNPQAPQRFYPVANKDMVLKKGDYLAWRCTYNNTEEHELINGNMNEDEMCNFYLGVTVDTDELPTFTGCDGVNFWRDFKDKNGHHLPPPPSDVV